MEKKIKVFGAALDATDFPLNIQTKYAYLNSLTQNLITEPNFLDPYEGFLLYSSILSKEKYHKIGKFPVESWLTPKPNIEDYPFVNQLEFQKFTINEKLKELRIIKYAFSRDGIPAYILENILPQLQEKVNVILLTIMKEAFYIEFKIQIKTKSKKIKDTFDIDIHRGNIKRNFNSCSGGEKVRISIAIRLAISELLSESIGVDLKFLLIDEIEYLDEEGLEKFLEIVNKLTKQFDSILIVSHIKELKEMFNNVMIVKGGKINVV